MAYSSLISSPLKKKKNQTKLLAYLHELQRPRVVGTCREHQVWAWESRRKCCIPLSVAIKDATFGWESSFLQEYVWVPDTFPYICSTCRGRRRTEESGGRRWWEEPCLNACSASAIRHDPSDPGFARSQATAFISRRLRVTHNSGILNKQLIHTVAAWFHTSALIRCGTNETNGRCKKAQICSELLSHPPFPMNYRGVQSNVASPPIDHRTTAHIRPRLSGRYSALFLCFRPWGWCSVVQEKFNKCRAASMLYSPYCNLTCHVKWNNWIPFSFFTICYYMLWCKHSTVIKQQPVWVLYSFPSLTGRGGQHVNVRWRKLLKWQPSSFFFGLVTSIFSGPIISLSTCERST